MPRKTMITKSLSKGVLGMKFMQKSKDVRDQEEEKRESEAVLSKNIPKILRSAGVEIKVVSSYKEVEELGIGRVSFKGMNPQVERIMKAEEEARVEAFLSDQRAKSNQPEISDEAMASVLSRNMRKRFNTKKLNKNPSHSEDSDCEIVDEPVKKPKFLKPVDV